MTERVGRVSPLAPGPGGDPGRRTEAAAGEYQPAGLAGLQRDVRILRLLEDASYRPDGQGWTNGRIAGLLYLDKAVVSRALRALVQTGLVERDPRSRTYRLGLSLYSLGMRAANQHLMRIAAKVVTDLVNSLGGRAYFVVRQGSSTYTLWSDQSPGSGSRVDSMGAVYPITAAPTGRALLHGMSADGIRRVLSDIEGTHHATDAFIGRVLADRVRGYSYGRMDIDRTGAIGVPLWDRDRNVLGAIGVSSLRLFEDQAWAREVAHLAATTASDAVRRFLDDGHDERRDRAVPWQCWPLETEESEML